MNEISNMTSRTNAAAISYANSATGKNSFSFNDLRTEARKVRTSIAQLEENRKARLKEIDSKYSRTYGEKLRAEINVSIDDKIREQKDGLSKRLDDLCKSKLDNIQKYVTEPPTARQSSIVSTLALRQTVSEAELRLYLTECAGNYSALSVLHELAERSGMSFLMPCNADEEIAKLTIAEDMARECLKDIGTPDADLGYKAAEFYSEYTDKGVLISAFNAVDHAPVFNDSVPEVTPLQKLADAAQKAYDRTNEAFKKLNETSDPEDAAKWRNANKAFNEITDFLDKNEENLETDSQRHDRVAREAEKLISGINLIDI